MLGRANAALGFAGRNGPLMLLGGVFLGLLAPPLADAARPLLGAAVFVFTLGAFLKVDMPAFRAELVRPAWVCAVLLWSTFGVPLVTLAGIRVLGFDPELGEGMLLAMLAPPVGSAAAIAAMLGLSAPLALLATLSATVIAPATLPVLAAWFTGAALAIDPVAMMLRLLLIVGVACLAATLLRRFAGRFVAANPHAMTGIAVAGLILVAIGAMRGMDAKIAAQPRHVLWVLGLAFLINAGFQALGATLFWATDRRRSLTVGLVSGNRNVTLVWAAAGPMLLAHPEAELYLAMSVFPIFMLPAAMRWMLGWRGMAAISLGEPGMAETVPSHASAEHRRL